MAASGVGGLIASLVIAKWSNDRHSLYYLFGALFGISACLTLVGMLRHAVLIAVVLLVLDIFWVACFIFGATYHQQVTSDAYLSRVETVDGLVFSIGAFVFLFSGWNHDQQVSSSHSPLGA